MKYYLHDADEVLRELQSTAEGFSSEEAEKRLLENGKNKLAEGKKVTVLQRFISQLVNPMIIVLLIAAAINLVTSIIENESLAEFFIIVGVVLLNAILGVIQEGKAEQAIEALKEMTASTCKVLRDGKITAIKNEDVVVGDIVILEAGDAVPADCRILENASVKAEEAALTGESVPVNKTADTLTLGENKDITLGDRKNMLYMGSTVVYGRAKAVVTAVGMQTEMGKIADVLAQTEAEVTPLQKKLNSLSTILSFLVLGICVFIFVFKIILDLQIGVTFDTILESFISAVSLAVAAIPEGLATVVTIVLSIGMTKMAKNRAVVKRLTAVETLGCTQIICSDKTGTLTQNKMTVVESFANDVNRLATAMMQCCDAVLDKDSLTAKGEPTECALVNYAYAEGLNKNEVDANHPRVSEAPFDSMRKMMSTLHSYDDKVVQFTKGAPDEILKRCAFYLEDGKALPMTDAKREEILTANKNMAEKALRVLAAAEKIYDVCPTFEEPSEIEKDLVFVGLTGMIDPVRPEVGPAIAKCKDAGIRTIMITGDHKDTAVAIAKELGIITDASQAMTGAELDDLTEEELVERLKTISVFARVQPEHKVKIVNGFKKMNYITAMTGDGVNDAPSIKSADIGIGMGITGTDVTKGAADMVLQDDNFATIVEAVGEGRRIYENIRKAIQFLLSSNLAEVVSMFLATMLGFTLLKPMHLLWINLITDTFPALALGMEQAEDDIMKRKPRKPEESIFAGGVGVNVIIQGVFIGFITLMSFLIGHYIENDYVWAWVFHDAGEIANDGMTMAFLTLSMTESFHSLNARSINHSIFTVKKQNMWLWGAFVLSLLLTISVIYIPPLANMFEFTQISLIEFAIAIGLAVTIIPFAEISKLIVNAINKKKNK
ncbi:MAG: cation-translocating P-type ATPase [Clostridia bacterium]|nr:cation-translocating P-type ATPase [Clostridia bacterium]